MKNVRTLLPYRSNSVIQDWIAKGIVSATLPDAGRGTGKRWKFTLHQLWDLLLVDQLAALRVFDKPYAGKNYTDVAPGDGNVREMYDYADLSSKVGEARIYPRERSRRHALDFYATFGRHVLVDVAVMRRLPPLDGSLQPVKQTRTERSRAKIGMLYYNITYRPENLQNYRTRWIEDAPLPSGLAEYRVLKDVVIPWREGKVAGKGPTLALISVDRLAEQVELGLHLPPNWPF